MDLTDWVLVCGVLAVVTVGSLVVGGCVGWAIADVIIWYQHRND